MKFPISINPNNDEILESAKKVTEAVNKVIIKLTCTKYYETNES